MILLIDYIPHTSSHPRARSRALKCGDGWRRRRRCAAKNLRDRSGDTRADWGGGRAAGSQVRARRPKPQGPDAPAAHHPRTIGGSVVPRNRPPDAAVVPTAVGRRCTRTKKGTAPERSAHRGSCGASLKNTARGTPKVRRTCGWQRRFRSSLPRPVDPGTGPVRGRVALVPRGAKVRGSLATPASRAPSDVFWGDAQTIRRRARPAPFCKNPGRAALAISFALPCQGEGRPPERSAGVAGWGRAASSDLAERRTPTRARCARHPPPAGEGEVEPHRNLAELALHSLP